MDCAFLMSDPGIDWSKWATVTVALIIGLGTFYLGWSQMKIAEVQKNNATAQKEIASNKLRLDLYQRRFVVYEAAAKAVNIVRGTFLVLPFLVTITSNNQETDVLRKMASAFDALETALFEAAFLFSEADGVEAALREISFGCSRVQVFVNALRSQHRTKTVPIYLEAAELNANNAAENLQIQLTQLQTQIRPYMILGDIHRGVIV